MRYRTLMVVIAAFAVILWIGLVVFVNQQPTTVGNQILFLVLFGSTIACTASPIAYAFGARMSRNTYQASAIGASLRRGGLLGVLSFALMALRFARLLTPLAGVLLTLLAVSIEMAITLRKR